MATLLDGSVRWYDLQPTELLSERAALFAPDNDGTELTHWVLFMPEGFFDHAGCGGNELVGIRLNRARNQQPGWVSFFQAYRVLYAPVLVRARLLSNAGPAQAWLAEPGDIRPRLARQPVAEVSAACIPGTGDACVPISLTRGQPMSLPAGWRRTAAIAAAPSYGGVNVTLLLNSQAIRDGNLGALSLGEYASRRVGQLARGKGHDQDALFQTI